jgi:hypothetical protein
MSGNSSGSPELAEEWQALLEPLVSPEQAMQTDARIQSGRFPDGEWVFGLSQNSHGLWEKGGGTLVVKDSRGRIRTFFGHVCGPNYLKGLATHTKNLDEFYDCLTHVSFKEQAVGVTRNGAND